MSDAVCASSELDASDPAARRAWYEVMDRSARADRPHALLEAFDAFELTVTEPGEHARRIRLEARDGDALVGVAELELPLTENLDVGWCEVNVLPEHRRRGAGRLLWQEVADRARAAGRTRVGGEVSVAPVDGGPGLLLRRVRWARSRSTARTTCSSSSRWGRGARRGRSGVRRGHLARSLPGRAPRGLPGDAQPDERRRAGR